MRDRVLFVERSGELRVPARLSGRSRGAAGKPSVKSAQGAQPPYSQHTQARNRVIYPCPGRSRRKGRWRAERTSVEKGGDEARVGEKFQPNPEIAGSPRNSFRASPGDGLAEVEHWIPAGASKPTKGYQTPNAAQAPAGSQAARDKSGGREGKSPDPRPRPPSAC